jgi:hypothetical protein
MTGKMNEAMERVKTRSHWGEVPCIAAHTAGWETGTSPARVGELINEAGLRISHCQLGLFGYGLKAEGKSKLIRPMSGIDPDVRSRIEATAREGVISCLACWKIASELEIERLAVGNAADALGFKVAPCQLGAF